MTHDQQLPGVPVRFDRDLHDRSEFDSGEPALDRWLREQAGQAARRDTTRTYVLAAAGRVIGYHSLCAFSVEREQAPGSTTAGAHALPAVLLARLAVGRAHAGRGLGAVLLIDSLRVSARVSEVIGARLFVVHALHERAADYYRAHGFRSFEAQPLTLYLTMKDVRATLRSLHML